MEPVELYRRLPALFEPSPHWKVFFACKRGRSHVATGKVCQDYCVAEKISDDIFVVAAADGHGGDAYVKSDVGSMAACNVVVELAKKYSWLADKKFLQKWTSPAFKAEIFDAWQAAVLKDYRAENPAAADSDKEIIQKYGTTLLFAVVTKNNVIVGQIGDGAILFCNDAGQAQLFKRHNPKFDSKTSSLASGQGIYSLIVEAYGRFDFKFNKILLSTDGIYDKLDRGDSFARYANELAERVRKNSVDEIAPFTVEGIDVSEKSSDDCTVAAIVAPPSNKKYELPLAVPDLSDLNFVRAYDCMKIFSARKDGVPLEIHVSRYFLKEGYSFDEFGGKVHLLLSQPEESRGNVNVFAPPDGLFRVQELIEHGEHLAKKYFADDEPPRFDNKFWLDFYETVRALKKFFAEKNYFAEENLFKTMLISADGEIFLFPDCLSKFVHKSDSSAEVFAAAESYFGFLGKLRCGEKVLPLFKCPKYAAGQIVPELRAADGKPFCRVVFNPKINAYGLQNLSEKIWLTDGKQVNPNQILRLTGDHVLEVPDGDEVVRCEINLFATE